VVARKRNRRCGGGNFRAFVCIEDGGCGKSAGILRSGMEIERPLRASAAAATAAGSTPAPAPAADAPRPAEIAEEAAQEPAAAKSNQPAAAVRSAVPEIQAGGSAAPDGRANGSSNLPSAKGLSVEQVMEIRGAIQAQQKFLGELLEHGHRWELDGAELRIFFATDKRPFAEMVEGRDSIEKIRSAASNVLNRPVRVCAKMEAVAATATPASRVSDSQELRAKFERDPMVRSMLQRFGGKISEVKRREEGL
jgi:hypothetical protein